MSTYGNQHVEGDKIFGGPTPALDIHVSKRQMECIRPTNDNPLKCWILADAGGQGAILKIAKQKLDSLGFIRGLFGFLTDLGRMTIEENMLRLVYSISEIKWIEDAASVERRDNHATKMKEIAPTAAKILIEDGYTVGTDLGEFTSGQTIRKGCITSMLLVVYEKRISYAKEKKGHVGLIAEKA